MRNVLKLFKSIMKKERILKADKIQPLQIILAKEISVKLLTEHLKK